jgi:dipeptidase
MMVITPAADNRDQSIPDAETVLVIWAAIGFASVEVMVLAMSNSTQLNMNKKNAVTPIPDRIIGMNIVTKNLPNL